MANSTFNEGLYFDEQTMTEVRDRFCLVDHEYDGKERIFFENAGGSFRLKSVIEISDKLNQYPDCFARDHAASKYLNSFVLQGREDFKALINAEGGSIVTALTASAVMFKIVEPLVEHGKGTNIVTTALEHPSASDSCLYYGKKYGKEVRIAHADPLTGGVSTEKVLELVDKDTCLLNVIAASNISGAMTDLKTIVAEARKINPDIYIVTDAVQHAPHGLLDVQDIPVDALNIAPYKFFGLRGLGLAWVSDRVKDLDHFKILCWPNELWEVGSYVPAQYASMSEIVNYVTWLGSKFTDKTDKRALIEEGMKRIHMQEQALLHRMLYGADGNSGLIAMEGVETFFDFSDLEHRDLIVGIHFDNMDCTRAVKEFVDRGVIVYDRIAAHYYSKQVAEFGADGVVRVSPLHCNTYEEVDKFLEVAKEVASL